MELDEPQPSTEGLERLITKALENERSPENLLEIESAIYKLGSTYAEQGESGSAKLVQLITATRPLLRHMSKAKAGKLVRTLVDQYLDMDRTQFEAAQALCKDTIEWCKTEKRTFLRQALETSLISLYISARSYSEALKLVNALNKELKKLDDKGLLVEVQLLESRTYHRLKNLPKARAALTSARTSANAIYCPPLLQATLDFQSGVLHAEENDFKTGYSYFYEAFEGYDLVNDERACSSLKYMLLCKIMLNLSDDIHAIIGGKLALRYTGRQIDAMKAVATAHHNRSLEEFQKVLEDYKIELGEDPIIESHLAALYSTMLEQNLCRLIEPFSCVEISHIAKLIKLPEKVVEVQLSKMILDKTFLGILDQGAGNLIVFEEQQKDATYQATLDTIERMGHVLDSLYAKAQRLS